jgi:hypothetical protein
MLRFGDEAPHLHASWWQTQQNGFELPTCEEDAQRPRARSFIKSNLRALQALLP